METVNFFSKIAGFLSLGSKFAGVYKKICSLVRPEIWEKKAEAKLNKNKPVMTQISGLHTRDGHICRCGGLSFSGPPFPSCT